MLKIPPVLELPDIELENQRVFLRTDLDAPVNAKGDVLDDSRIRIAAKTIRALSDAGARIIVGSRFGEVRGGLGSQAEGSKAPSIEPAAARLSEILRIEVLLPDGCVGDAVKKVTTSLREGQICVLENLCQESDLGEGREAFARQLMSQFDAYVGDDLRALTLPSATATILPRLLETRAVGSTLSRELTAARRIHSAVDDRQLLIWGGTALSSRLPLLQTLLKEQTRVFLVGVAAQTMLAALGGRLGKSRIEESYLAGARTLRDRLGDRLLLPTDFVAAENSRQSQSHIVPARDVPAGLSALDLGPDTRQTLAEEIGRADLTVWCGTAGLHREAAFSAGTRSLLDGLASAEGFTAIVGDDTVAAARALDAEVDSKINHVATGGDATLALLNETKLPGLEALRGTLS